MMQQSSLFGGEEDGTTLPAAPSVKSRKKPSPKPSLKSMDTATISETPKKIKQPSKYLSQQWLEDVHQRLIMGVRSYFDANRYKRAVIGVSGGVDSALTLKIAVDALGAENVSALIMPELSVTSDENCVHAKMLCEFFGVPYYYVPINSYVSSFIDLPWEPNHVAIMNCKARIRMTMLYSLANSEKALVLGTSNLTEILLGYGTKYGDLAADIEVIGELYKTEVIKVAEYVGLPPEIAHKTPSAELVAGQSDEEELGAPYPDIDKVLMRRELGREGCVAHGLPLALVQLVFRRMDDNGHKRAMPPVIESVASR